MNLQVGGFEVLGLVQVRVLALIRASGFGFRVLALGFRVYGSGFRVGISLPTLRFTFGPKALTYESFEPKCIVLDTPASSFSCSGFWANLA